MTINNLLNENLIDINLEANTKEEVLEKMADILFREGILNSKENYLDDVLEREKLGTTGVGMSIAIPHGKSKSVKKTAVAIAKLQNPVEWNSLDNKPVKMVFLLAVPEGDDKNHLKLLSKLAAMLIDDGFREKLLNAESKDDILDAVNLSIK